MLPHPACNLHLQLLPNQVGSLLIFVSLTTSLISLISYLRLSYQTLVILFPLLSATNSEVDKFLNLIAFPAILQVALSKKNYHRESYFQIYNIILLVYYVLGRLLGPVKPIV